ncbi:MAG: nucleotidyltransferase domain-containing protein [Cytophagales bacterium]
MLIRKALDKLITDFLADLRMEGYVFSKVYLFGSYAKGKPKQHSDVDLALWHEIFTGVSFVNIVPFLHLVGKYRPIELHTFNDNETDADDGFIEEILKTGLQIT